jgi:DNA-binding HxlR family transcriptional regulator
VAGEWWTLLIIRDALRGARRFEEFKRTGIADNILTTRLRRLVEAGIFERSRYQQRPDRYAPASTTTQGKLDALSVALGPAGLRWPAPPHWRPHWPPRHYRAPRKPKHQAV